MKKIYFNLLTLFLSIFSVQAFAQSLVSSQIKFDNKDYKNVTAILLNEFGWKPHQIGPFGQAYRIDINLKNMVSFLDLHPLVKKQYGGFKRTSICDLLPKNKFLVLNNKNLIETGFSQDTAISARKKYIITGQNLTDREWQLSDQYTWLTYISEGTGTTDYRQTIFNKPLKIQECTSHSVKVTYDGKSITFPNLILTIPDYVYIQTGSNYKKNIGYKKSNVSKMINETTNSLLIAINYLIDTNQWDLYDHRSFAKKLIRSKIKPRNYILLGKICEYSSIEKCAKMLNHIYVAEDPNMLLDYAYKKLKSEFKYN